MKGSSLRVFLSITLLPGQGRTTHPVLCAASKAVDFPINKAYSCLDRRPMIYRCESYLVEP
jgi:hypothetical protein